jgi:hypothetical protein
VFDNEQQQQRSTTDIALIPPATGSYCSCPEVTISDHNRLLLVTLGKSRRLEQPFILIYTTYERQETLIEIAFFKKKHKSTVIERKREEP